MKENPKHIRISEYNYPLPDERIAKFPLPVRDQSKLLIYRHGEVSEDVFTSLPEYLPAGSGRQGKLQSRGQMVQAELSCPYRFRNLAFRCCRLV